MLLKSTQMQDIAQSLARAGQDFHRAINKTLPIEGSETQLVGVNLSELLFAAGGLLLAFALRWFLIWTVGRILHGFSSDSSHDWQDSFWVLLMRYISAALIMMALFYAFSVIELPKRPLNWDLWLWQCFLSFAIAYAVWLIVKTIEFTIKRLMARAQLSGRLNSQQILPLIRDLLKVGAIILAVILGVQIWGYNATTLLAGVGLGGLAVAFAAQDFIANILGTMVVWSDHPYKVGDHVIMNEVEGTVEEIGVRSTRIRMFDRTLVSVPNKHASNEKVYNIAAMNKRRIRFSIGLVYDTTPQQLQAAVDALLELMAGNEELEAETSWAWFTGFGAYSQDILLQCFTKSADFQEFLRVRHHLLLAIRRRFNEMGLEFAFPTQVEYTIDASGTPPSATPAPAAGAERKKGGRR